MAASSWVATPTGPQVFINFRGEDVRKHFVSFLAPALKGANINVFIDEDEFFGTELAHLLKRIEESEIALVIFSKNYADSDWCLDELAKIKERKDQGRLIAIPIFYNLNTSVVKQLRGEFGDKFRDLKRNHLHQPERTQKWEEALVSIPDIKGMPVGEQSDKTDHEFINLLVIGIQKLLADKDMRGSRATISNRQGGSMVPARQLEITHSEDSKLWVWSSINEAPGEAAIEIAIMNEVYWMDIRGSFHTRKLTPETKYKVVFVVKLEDTATGWHEPVKLNLNLIMRDKSEILQEQTFYLEDCIGDEWAEVKAGDFVAPPKDAPARISFTMFQYDNTIRKTGLVVKGVAIREVD